MDRLAGEFIKAVMVSGARTLLWYGQGYAPDSFTALIPRLARAAGGITLVAFLDEVCRDAFREAWSQPVVSQLRIMVFTARLPTDPREARRILATRAA